MESSGTNTGFVKCYLNLCQMFDPAEMIFLLNMLYMEHLNLRGINPNWSKTFLMKKMRIGEKVFKRCEKKFLQLGLLYEVKTGKRKKYGWHMENYEKLLRIVNSSANIFIIERLCKKVFGEANKNLYDMSETEIVTALNYINN